MKDFARAIDRDGFAIVSGILDEPLIRSLKGELEGAIAKEVEWHGGRIIPTTGWCFCARSTALPSSRFAGTSA
jgi:hypothetical protein